MTTPRPSRSRRLAVLLAAITLMLPPLAALADDPDPEIEAAQQRLNDLKARRAQLARITAADAAEVQRPATPKNPDRYPSIGFLFSGAGMGSSKGTSTVQCALCNPSSVSQDFTGTGSAFILDLRLPISFWLTVTAFGQWGRQNQEARETSQLFGQLVTSDFSAFGIGARIYLPGLFPQ